MIDNYSHLRYNGRHKVRKNRNILEALPDTLTIYRGDDSSGFSWSLCEDVATSFGTVHTKQIDKSEIFGYISDRQEFEIILLS